MIMLSLNKLKQFSIQSGYCLQIECLSKTGPPDVGLFHLSIRQSDVSGRASFNIDLGEKGGRISLKINVQQEIMVSWFKYLFPTRRNKLDSV